MEEVELFSVIPAYRRAGRCVCGFCWLGPECGQLTCSRQHAFLVRHAHLRTGQSSALLAVLLFR